MRPQQREGAAGPSAPVALGQLPDLELVVGEAMSPQSVSVDFVGSSLVYALAPSSALLPEGITLTETGVISGTPIVETGPVTIVVRGSNGQGSADSAFTLTVQVTQLDFAATISGLTQNPTHGLSAQSGVQIVAAAGGYSGVAPQSVSFQWATVESGDISGATQAEFTPSAMTYDGEALFCRITPAGYPAKNTPSYAIRHAPPVAAGALWDEIADLGSGPEKFDVSHDFTGLNLVFSVAGPGVTIEPATGLLTIQTDAAVPGATVTVTATNSGGVVQSSFLLTVEAGDLGPGPYLAPPVLDPAADEISLTVDSDCTIWWRRDPTGTNPDAAQVMAGGGLDSGSFVVSAGSAVLDITFSTGSDGWQEISFVAAVSPDEPSIVQTVAIEIDTTDPALLASQPEAGAVGVATDAALSLTFDEAMNTNAGSVTLARVGGAAVEIFDLVSLAGDAGGLAAWTMGGTLLTLTPGAELESSSEYALRWSGLTDNDGNRLADNSGDTAFSFVTEATYAQQLVNTNGSAVLVHPAFGGNEPSLTFSLWLRPATFEGTQDILSTSGRSRISLQGASLSLLLKDTANAVCYSGVSSGAPFVLGQIHHLYVAADFAADALVIELDGQPIAMDTPTTAFASAAGAVDFDRSTTIFAGGVTSFSAAVGDLAIFNTIVPNAVLWNGGVPPDPETLMPVPRILLGGSMTADQRLSNTAQGWNDGFNAGVGGPLNVLSATFTDVT